MLLSIKKNRLLLNEMRFHLVNCKSRVLFTKCELILSFVFILLSISLTPNSPVTNAVNLAGSHIVQHALCPMLYALCSMPYALCPMPYALCPMLPIFDP